MFSIRRTRNNNDRDGKATHRAAALALLCVLLTTSISVAQTGTKRYQYDRLGRLIRVELPDGHMIEYVYDAAGNILSRNDPMADRDGDGVPDAGIPGSGVPPDCAPTDPTVYPGAPEINDGKDNQCSGDPGYGLVDEIMGPLVFASGSKTLLNWPAQQGATMYEVDRSSLRTFASKCSKVYSPTAELEAEQIPPAAGAYYYLVRSYLPNAGSWGANSAGAERTVCP